MQANEGLNVYQFTWVSIDETAYITSEKDR